jgi:SAM-dependent methyltransferase
MIDRTLNYGRDVLKGFLRSSEGVKTALDIGAGHGDDLASVREVYPEARLFAIECYPENVRQLQENGIIVHPQDVERDRFPFAPGSLDVVIANQIFEHTKEIFWILDQVSTVLKEGGHFLIGVPNLAALHNRILLALGRQPSPLKNNSAHVRGFTKPDLLQLLESAFPGGYRLVHFGGGNFYPFPPFLARPLARLFPTMAWGIFLDFVKTKPYEGEFLKYPQSMQLETNFYLGR